MYDPTYAHKITMTLYEDRLRSAAASVRTRPGTTGALRALLGRAVPHIAHRSTATLAPEPAPTLCIP